MVSLLLTSAADPLLANDVPQSLCMSVLCFLQTHSELLQAVNFPLSNELSNYARTDSAANIAVSSILLTYCENPATAVIDSVNQTIFGL